MKRVFLGDWSEFEGALRAELKAMGYTGLVTARNFQLVTFTEDCEEVDRLAIALSTGTDRDAESSFWNVGGFDHPHDTHPTGKRGDEIIYAFTIDLSRTPYLVCHDETPRLLDIVDNLTEHEGLIVYDSRKLDRRTKNEYWFKTSPLEAALLLFTLRPDD